MPQSLIGLAIVLFLASAVGLAMQMLSHARDHAAPTWPQKAPFLGGGTQDAHAWQRYHVRYYPMLLLFIAFEMEMMFMYPWAVVFVAEGGKAMVEMGMFLTILAVGILYGWREGVFRWQ